jgi:hypothetical protein
MNRVGGYVCVPVGQFDFDNYEVVNMVQVIADLIRSDLLRRCATNDNVAGCTISDLVGNMGRHMELSFVPAELKLPSVSDCGGGHELFRQ